MVSSSCSYAASAMAKSLFAKGADYIAAMVFMFASTNLVVELGIVLIVLMGWQFAVSEFVGGLIMILLLATLGALWLRGRLVVEARERLEAAEAGAARARPPHAAEDDGRGPTRRGPLMAHRLRSPAEWADSATYTMADLTMLRRELVIGYVVAGFLAVLVPTSVWQAVFITGHGVWTSIENALVGPFIAIISFVCSIGNVPLAAALVDGGISFGGVIAFIFADLITFPLLLIYRRYYGTRLMLRMLVVFWALMSSAGLLTERHLPRRRPGPDAPAGHGRLGRLLVELHDLPEHRLPRRCSASCTGSTATGSASAAPGATPRPVCGMQVEMAHAPASAAHDGQRVYFCSDRCAERFASERSDHAKKGSAAWTHSE